MKKMIWGLVLATVLGFIAYRAVVAVKEKQAVRQEAVAERKVPVHVGTPVIRTIADEASQTGTIIAESEITLYSKVNGKLVRNLVEMNDAVKPNQVVAVVDRDEVGYEYNQFEVRTQIGGTVAKVFLNSGAVVNPNVPLMQVVAMDRVKALVAVREDRIRFVRVGQTAEVAVDAYPGEHFEGRVTNISPLASAQTRTVDVEIRIPNPAHRLKPGMFAQAVLKFESRKAMLVPLGAVTEREGRNIVFVVRDSVAELRPVTIGIAVGDQIEIVSGLGDDERIAVMGTQRLNDRDPVTIVEKP